MLKTHTGARIHADAGWWSCGNWFVLTDAIEERRPGRARQMRRMVAKARRREWRAAWEKLLDKVHETRRLKSARTEVRFGGTVIGHATNIRLGPADAIRDTVTVGYDFEPLPAVNFGFSLEGRHAALDNEPETESERAAVDAARDDVARGDVMSLDEAKVSLAGGEE